MCVKTPFLYSYTNILLLYHNIPRTTSYSTKHGARVHRHDRYLAYCTHTRCRTWRIRTVRGDVSFMSYVCTVTSSSNAAWTCCVSSSSVSYSSSLSDSYVSSFDGVWAQRIVQKLVGKFSSLHGRGFSRDRDVLHVTPTYLARHTGHIIGDIHQYHRRFTAENLCPHNNWTPVRFSCDFLTCIQSENDKRASAIDSIAIQHSSIETLGRMEEASAAASKRYPHNTFSPQYLLSCIQPGKSTGLTYQAFFRWRMV